MSWEVIEFFKSICLSRLSILVYTFNIRVYYLNSLLHTVANCVYLVTRFIVEMIPYENPIY